MKGVSLSRPKKCVTRFIESHFFRACPRTKRKIEPHMKKEDFRTSEQRGEKTSERILDGYL